MVYEQQKPLNYALGFRTVGFRRPGLCLSLLLAGENGDVLSTGLLSDGLMSIQLDGGSRRSSLWLNGRGTFELDHHESGAGSRCPEEETAGQRPGGGKGPVSLRKQQGVARDEVGRSAGRRRVQACGPQSSSRKGARGLRPRAPRMSNHPPTHVRLPLAQGGFLRLPLGSTDRGPLRPEAGGGSFQIQRQARGQAGPGKEFC